MLPTWAGDLLFVVVLSIAALWVRVTFSQKFANRHWPLVLASFAWLMLLAPIVLVPAPIFVYVTWVIIGLAFPGALATLLVRNLHERAASQQTTR